MIETPTPIHAVPVTGIGEIQPGDRLDQALLPALRAAGVEWSAPLPPRRAAMRALSTTLSPPTAVVEVPAIRWKNGALSGLATMALTKLQLRRLGAGRRPRPNAWAPWVLVRDRLRTARRSRRYRSWLQGRPVA